jgi:DNA-binding FrmR family transcriptional regulator
MLDEKTRKDVTVSLGRIEGQVRGIIKMIESGRYCIDLLTQTSAAEAALHRVSETILRKHLQTCVVEAFRSGSEEEAEKKIKELMAVYARCRAK